ncbi:MAG: ABC transporter permease [Chloroflexota bacterium]
MSISAIPDSRSVSPAHVLDGDEGVSAAVARWRDSEQAVTPRSYYGEVGRRLLRDRSALVALGILGVIVGTSILAPVISPHDPITGDVAARLRPIGTPGYILGTDEQGRDMLTRLLYGGQLSLMAGIVPVAIATVFGTLIGAMASYMGKATGAVLMRIMDMSYAFPAILLAIAIASSLGAGIGSSIVALSIVFVPPISRVAESATRGVMVQEYIEAARISGASTLWVIFDQVLPNIFSPIFVYASSLVGLSILIASALSFIGLGSAPPTPEWGAMLNGMRPSIYTRPAVAALPGLLIFLTSVGFNMLSTSLRDALDVKHS